eukprot:s3765_g3.t1
MFCLCCDDDWQPDLSYAVARGFTEVELGNFRAIFEHLDVDNSGRLEMNEVRQCLNIIQLLGIVDRFAQIRAELGRTEAQGHLAGIFALDREQKVPNLVSKLDDRTLRSVLSQYGLSKSYLWALDRAQLAKEAGDTFWSFWNPIRGEFWQEKGESLDAVRWCEQVPVSVGTEPLGELLRRGQLYAVKRLELRGSAMDRERLLQECALLPRLTHLHIVRYYQAGFAGVRLAACKSLSTGEGSGHTH